MRVQRREDKCGNQHLWQCICVEYMLHVYVCSSRLREIAVSQCYCACVCVYEKLTVTALNFVTKCL